MTTTLVQSAAGTKLANDVTLGSKQLYSVMRKSDKLDYFFSDIRRSVIQMPDSVFRTKLPPPANQQTYFQNELFFLTTFIEPK